MASLGATWVVKRLTKVLLKRHLSHLLATEVDVQQLEIQLENGCFEIRDCLLDSEYLNSKLTEYPFSVQSALVERMMVSLFPLTIQCHGVAIVMSEKEFNIRRKDSETDISERLDRNSKSILDDGLGLMEDIMQGLFSKLCISGKDILICATLLTGHELCLVTKQISFVSDAKNLGRKIDLDGMSLKIIGNEGVEHFMTQPIQATILMSQESNSHKDAEPRVILSFTISEKVTLYATEVAISLLQNLLFLLQRWKSVLHLSGEASSDFSRSLHKVLGLPESIDSGSVDIWQTLEDRAVAGNLEDSEEDENAMSALTNLMSAIFFSTESVLLGSQEDGQHSVFCVKGRIPGCTLKFCNSTEHFSDGILYFLLEDIDLLCNFEGPCECDVSFASFQICKQSDITLGEGDHASLFDDWLMPEGSEVLSSTKTESIMADTIKKLENLENDPDRPTDEKQANRNSLVPVLYCQQQDYRQRISLTFSDSIGITMTMDLILIWMDNLIPLRLLPLSESEEIATDDQKQDFEVSLDFRKILLGSCNQIGDQQFRCVLMLQTGHEGTTGDITSEGLHALVTSDSISISVQVELAHLSIAANRSDTDFLRFEGMKLQYLAISNERTIAIKSKADDLRGEIFAKNFNQIEAMIKHFRHHVGSFSGSGNNAQVDIPYSITIDAVTIRCDIHGDFGYLKGSVHLVDLIFRSDRKLSCEGASLGEFSCIGTHTDSHFRLRDTMSLIFLNTEVNLDILDALIWRQESEGSLPLQPRDGLLCEIKSMLLLLHNATETAEADVQVNAKNVSIGRLNELVSISTVSLEHADAGVLAMFSGLRAIQAEYLTAHAAKAYLLLSNLKTKYLQEALDSVRNIFIPRDVAQQQDPDSSVSCEMRSSTIKSNKSDPLVYDCDVQNLEVCDLALQGIWYESVNLGEHSDRYLNSVEVKSLFRSNYVGTKIENSLLERSLEVSVDKFELLYENYPVDSPTGCHGSLRFDCTSIKYQKGSGTLEISRISTGSISAYFSYESSSDNVREDLVFEMPRRSLLRSEDAFSVDFERIRGKTSLSIDAAGFRLCIYYCFVQWLREIHKGLSIVGDWEYVGEESDISFDFQFHGAACSFSYVPSSVKLSSVKSKSPEDLLRLVPSLQAELWLCEANLVDAVDLREGGRMLASVWLNDITKVQLNRFLLDLPGYRAMRQIKERTNWNLDENNLEHVALRCLFSLARYLVPESEPKS